MSKYTKYERFLYLNVSRAKEISLYDRFLKPTTDIVLTFMQITFQLSAIKAKV